MDATKRGRFTDQHEKRPLRARGYAGSYPTERDWGAATIDRLSARRSRVGDYWMYEYVGSLCVDRMATACPHRKYERVWVRHAGDWYSVFACRSHRRGRIAVRPARKPGGIRNSRGRTDTADVQCLGRIGIASGCNINRGNARSKRATVCDHRDAVCIVIVHYAAGAGESARVRRQQVPFLGFPKSRTSFDADRCLVTRFFGSYPLAVSIRVSDIRLRGREPRARLSWLRWSR